jgi:hypothetical protein
MLRRWWVYVLQGYKAKEVQKNRSRGKNVLPLAHIELAVLWYRIAEWRQVIIHSIGSVVMS